MLSLIYRSLQNLMTPGLLPFVVKHVNVCEKVLDQRVSHIQSSGNVQPAGLLFSEKKFSPSQQRKTKISVGLHAEPILKGSEFGVTFEQVISTVALSSLGIFHHVVGKFIHMP